MKIVFAIMGVALIVAAIVLGSPLQAFINGPSLLIVVGLVLCVGLANHTTKEVSNAFQVALSNEPVDPNEGQRHAAVLQTFRIAATGAGITGTFIGFIQMLANMDDPSKIGPAMAVALLTIFYAVLLSELLLGPLINRIHARMNTAPSQASKPAGPNNVLNISGILCSLFAFTTMLVSMGGALA